MSDMKIQSFVAPLVSRFQSNPVEDTPSIDAVGELAKLSAGEDFASKLKDAVRAVNNEQQQASTLQTQFELGDDNVSLPQVMLAMNRASISFEAINQVRNRLLTAYQEIMNMQV
ncbi:flagellar hook-basal body complex protein FliE [Chromatium okenii]|jgi:flagellar hook-basal body complex protein FliE|uniref:Flagellar hook-basal body complex protein FliE n=1 Tax=Chromatium okenii TaxID=61644 RepID=A0A2S7XQR2_9GAMM|nr:flagellar hook-basal body complex protein FliE [Chromatium okenii]MBV5308574.1 flagellar hook-basal body complex protein FliE [Chromatium okenii]PQJ95772.1 flagellar hook-basal body complex protein FliE [Chromatium okenii]